MVKTRREILRRLARFSKMRGGEFGLLRIGVFGSAARDQLGPQSDVDVVVEISEPDLLLLVGIQQELRELFGRQVDIVHYRPTMNPLLKQCIDQEAVYAG
jgi:predicted nucleotidyltransferase